jgi:anti-sigma factor RsiW
MRGLFSRLRFRLDHAWTPPNSSPYLDGELSRTQSARLERHIEECPECRELLRALNTLIVALGTLHDRTGTPVAQTILSSVRGRIDEAPRDNP